MYLLMVDPNGQRRIQQRPAVHHAYTQILTDSFASVNSPPVSLLELGVVVNPDNGFLHWQREEREAGGRGFEGIELIGG